MGESGRHGVKRQPRTCVGCRETDQRSALLRFAIGDEPPTLAPDLRGRLGGRGASVHPRWACLEAAVRGGGFDRAFRRRIDVTTDGLARVAVGQFERRLSGLLVSSLRAGRALVGADAARGAFTGRNVRRPKLLIFASDAAGRREELAALSERDSVPSITYGTKSTLGRALGRNEVAVVAIMDEQIAREVAHAARCVAELSEER